MGSAIKFERITIKRIGNTDFVGIGELGGRRYPLKIKCEPDIRSSVLANHIQQEHKCEVILWLGKRSKPRQLIFVDKGWRGGS